MNKKIIASILVSLSLLIFSTSSSTETTLRSAVTEDVTPVDDPIVRKLRIEIADLEASQKFFPVNRHKFNTNNSNPIQLAINQYQTLLTAYERKDIDTVKTFLADSTWPSPILLEIASKLGCHTEIVTKYEACHQAHKDLATRANWPFIPVPDALLEQLMFSKAAPTHTELAAAGLIGLWLAVSGLSKFGFALSASACKLVAAALPDTILQNKTYVILAVLGSGTGYYFYKKNIAKNSDYTIVH